MTTTSDQMRAWTGPALFSYGFRPFFLGAALWAAFAMGAWIAMLSGFTVLPIGFDPVSWHAHEFLFGYLSAVIAGFLMTAVPNWTGRTPIVGWPLAALWAVWLLGRAAVALSGVLPVWAVIVADMAFLIALVLAMTREILAGKNWRNLAVVGLLGVFIIANAIFHLEAALGHYAAQGYGLRLGLAVAMMLIALIGGRIVPSFTRNWLVQQGRTARPSPPMQRFDKHALLALAGALGVWVIWPLASATSVALIGSGALHAVRLWRWKGPQTGAEPLLWVLHLGYACLPLGAVALGVAGLWPDQFGQAPAQHLWMAGAVGLMTLAVMTRATLGHTGQALHAGRGTTALYVALSLSVLARFTAGFVPDANGLYAIAGVLWIGAFAGFSALYGQLLLSPRKA